MEPKNSLAFFWKEQLEQKREAENENWILKKKISS